MPACRFYALAALVVMAALPAVAADPAEEWVARARAIIAPESTLNAVKSLHYEGTVETMERVPDPAAPGKEIDRPISRSIDIVFQKPMQHRQILRSEKIEHTTTLDGYDAWEKVSDRTNKTPPRISLLDQAAIKRLRASTIENLSFYANHDQDSREVRLLGDALVDGLACVKLSFTHRSSIVYLRYFDKSTGRLVKTEIEDGGEIREEGQIIASGIRFPRKMLNQTPDGKVATITIDKVTVGERFPADVFAVPVVPVK